MPVLSQSEIQQKLAALPGWTPRGNEIGKTFQLSSFLPAIEFVRQIAGLAEAAQHHPDIVINYNKVTLTLSTHSEGGVTAKDIELAGKIEKLPRG